MKKKPDFFEKFESINDFVKTINSRETASFYECEFSKLESEGQIKFTGTKSYQEAENLLLHGWKEPVKELSAIKANPISQVTETRNTVYHSPVGFVPNIPRALAGNPCNMMNVRQQQYKSTKVVNIVYSITYDSTATHSNIMRVAKSLLASIIFLEKRGYRCNIYIYNRIEFYHSKNYGTFLLRIKDSNEPLNLNKITFPLIHPSMLRRLYFRWVETNGKTSDKSYGHPLMPSPKQLKEIFKGKKVATIDFQEFRDYENQILNSIEKQLK